MKILIYIDSMQPAAGIERVVSRLSSIWVEKLDWNVGLLTKDNKNSFYDLNKKIKKNSLFKSQEKRSKYKLVRIFNILFNAHQEIANIKRNISKKEYDYIYSTTPLNTFYLTLAGYRDKIIASEHGSYYGYNKIYRILKKVIYPRVKFINTLTNEDKAIYDKMGCNVFCTPNPLSFNVKKKAELKNKIVLNIGRLTFDKGQDQLLEVWKDIVKEFPEWQLKIIGKGEEKDKLISLIKEYNLENNVIISDPTNYIVEEYLNSSIFVLSSRYEGYGMVLIEAMSCGVPCISFNCPTGPRHIIEKPEQGILIENRDLKEMKKKIIELIKNQNLRVTIGENGKNKTKEYSDERIAFLWEKALKGDKE